MSESTEKKTFGRSQKIALTALAVPFTVATAFVWPLAIEGASPQWWGGFTQVLVPTVVGITLLGAAWVKAKRSGE